MSNPTVQRLHDARARIANDAAVRWLVIVSGALLVLVVVFGALMFGHQARSASLSGELSTKSADLVDATDEIEALRDKVTKYEPAYIKSGQLDNRETSVSSREASVTDREAKVEAANASLDAREATVQDRERKAAENASAGDWWVAQVRECLARSGSNRIATVTEGSIIGRDTTCYTQ